MEITQPTAISPAPPQTNSPGWLDIILYLAVGFGGYLVASFVASQFVQGNSLTVSIAAYALNLVFLGGSVVALGFMRGKLDPRAIGFVPPRLNVRWFFGAIALSLLILPLRGLIGIAVQALFGGDMGSLQDRMDMIAPDGFTWLGFVVTLIGAGILAPIAEELFFRGALFTWFRKRFNFRIALLASSALFGLGHFDSIAVVAASFVFGIFAAWAFERTKSLWVPIIMHITTNSFAVLIIYAGLALGA